MFYNMLYRLGFKFSNPERTAMEGGHGNMDRGVYIKVRYGSRAGLYSINVRAWIVDPITEEEKETSCEVEMDMEHAFYLLDSFLPPIPRR